MKCWKYFRKIINKNNMDCNDLEPVDMIVYITEELQARYHSAKDVSSYAQIFQDFLRRWEADSALDVVKQQKFEFEKDLDWFNVNQPLTLTSLHGKLVILDFFTYCCINCMHVLPELHKLEELYPIERGLIVVGVHSPKFENEKVASNILAAAQRYGIKHPIVNDERMSLWRCIGVKCWPTLLLLGPSGAPLLMLMGEGHGLFLEHFVGEALRFFGKRGELKNFLLPLKPLDLQPASKLCFPSKIALSDEGIFAIADAGNHRVLVVNTSGTVLHKIGSGVAGLIDGDFFTSCFNSPQGVVFLENDVLIVADTENHALRKASLSTGLVETLVGTGEQGHDRIGGKIGPLQDISSPWDVAVFRTRDMDMSFHMDEQNIPEKNIVLIAMAGTHQIWGYFPEGVIWWKFRKFEPGTCVSLIGNGTEENRNNSYPQNAAFSQPSGLAMAKDFLYIADSESSSIRKASMVDGKVLPVVGGDRNPQNLFAFGDVDGKQYAAKLQHPLAVTYNKRNDKVYVADTYNHKIKIITLQSNTIETLPIKSSDGVSMQEFGEPAGLCVDSQGEFILVSDTNNHRILRVCLKSLRAETFSLNFNSINNNTVTDGPSNFAPELIKSLPLRRCKKLKLLINITLDDQLKFTAEAPQKWSLISANSTLKSLQTRGVVENGKITLNLQRVEGDILIPPIECLKIRISLNLCDAKTCLMKSFSVVLNDEEETCPANVDNLLNEECVHVHITTNHMSLT
uniref:Thioredoxin domain-containing protein n=1 Tax=Glossina pallidipes TaxID=7398 RepID=A0A1A9Z455_GLOPL